MKTQKTNFLTTLKIVIVYSFALATAVACGKFESNKTPIKGATVRGAGNVVREGNPGVISASNITINKVQTVFLGVDDFDDYKWSLKIDMNHGARNLVFDVFPKVNPIVPDAAFKTAGSIDYTAQGVCGNELCSKFVVMINIRDVTTGVTGQKVQLWDVMQNNSAAVRTLTDTDFATVAQAYTTLTGEEIPFLDGE
jgi:hypothetical protein